MEVERNPVSGQRSLTDTIAEQQTLTFPRQQLEVPIERGIQNLVESTRSSRAMICIWGHVKQSTVRCKPVGEGKRGTLKALVMASACLCESTRWSKAHKSHFRRRQMRIDDDLRLRGEGWNAVHLEMNPAKKAAEHLKSHGPRLVGGATTGFIIVPQDPFAAVNGFTQVEIPGDFRAQ